MFSGMSEQQHQSDAPQIAESYLAHFARQFTVQNHRPPDSTLVRRVELRLAPWGCEEGDAPYPGRMKLLVESVLWRVGYSAITKWRQGKNRFPAWAARQWAAVLTARAEADLALARELTEHAEREEANPRVLRGCCAVRDRGGVVRDGRGGYRAKLPDVEASR